MTERVISADGNCLGPSSNGAQFVAHTDELIRPGDLCTAELKPGSAWHEAMGVAFEIDGPRIGVTKYFLARTTLAERDVLMLGQTNPPAISLVPLDEVAVLHRIVIPEGRDLCRRPENAAAWALLAPFLGTKTAEPIQPFVTRLRHAVEAKEHQLSHGLH